MDDFEDHFSFFIIEWCKQPFVYDQQFWIRVFLDGLSKGIGTNKRKQLYREYESFSVKTEY